MRLTSILFQLQRSVNTLTADLKSMIVGQLLSDAYVYKSSPTASSRLEWSFGAKYKDYADWLQTLLSPLCNVGVNAVKVKATSKATGITTVHTNYRLKTATSSVFNLFYDMFYKLDTETNKYVKVVPLDILSLMNSIVLAHLIMGDGNWHATHNRVRIYTNSFTHSDCVRLAEAITAMGITTSVLLDRVGKNGKNQYFLAISGAALTTLRAAVAAHIHPSMLYRIGM